MFKYRNSVGWHYYVVSAPEVYSWGGACICDDCGRFCPSGGYLVPVLNHFQCPKCFNEWSSNSSFYPKDLSFERRVMKYFESILPCIDTNLVK